MPCECSCLQRAEVSLGHGYSGDGVTGSNQPPLIGTRNQNWVRRRRTADPSQSVLCLVR